jgi:hypothetical protein
MLLAACAAVLLIAALFLLTSGLTGWSGNTKQLASAPTGTKSVDAQSPAVPAAEAPETPSPTSASPLVVEETAPSLAGAPPRMLLPEMNNTASPTGSIPSGSGSPLPAARVATDESAYGYGETPLEPVPPTNPNASKVQTVASVAAPTNVPSGTEGPESVTAGSARPATAEGIAPGAEAPAQPPADVTAAMEEEAFAETSRKPAELGTYLDSKNVLLRYDPANGAWFRLASRSPLATGDKLLALPAFFPKLSLASGLHLKLVGGTMITFGPQTSGLDGLPIDVVYGKLVIVNTANDENKVRLTIGRDSSNVSLGRNATLAVDVVRKYQPGQDPRQSPSPIVAQIYVRDGDVVWEQASGSTTIPAPGHWSIEDGVATAVTSDVSFPDWIDQEPVEQRSEQLFGAPVVEQMLNPARPVQEQLLELYQSSRRREVKSLVARSSVYAGLFVPFVEALRDSEQRATWKMHIETLRSAMALGPESADKIWQTLVEQRGEAPARDLYEMLCGYSSNEIGNQEQFQNGVAARLVDWMENDSLDYRVLAVQDMGEITGMRLMPNPAGSPTERARGVRIWRQRLKAGEIVPVSQ